MFVIQALQSHQKKKKKKNHIWGKWLNRINNRKKNRLQSKAALWSCAAANTNKCWQTLLHLYVSLRIAVSCFEKIYPYENVCLPQNPLGYVWGKDQVLDCISTGMARNCPDISSKIHRYVAINMSGEGFNICLTLLQMLKHHLDQ